MLDEVAGYHVQRKRARILHMMAQFIDDLPSSDTQADPRSSSPSSLSSISSPSSGLSDSSTSPRVSLNSSSGHSSTTSGRSSGEFDSLEDQLLERWDAQIQTLATHLLTARVLDFSPPVTKLGQLDLYLTDFRHNHPDRFRKKLRVSPPVFDRLVELIEDHNVFHNNSNVPQQPISVQLAIFLVRVGHYGNASAPEYIAQWAGVCVGTVINATYRCLVAFLALHDEAVMMPPEEEKERAKEYVERATCPEWRNGFLLADGTKFVLFQKPGLHGEAWFDKNKDYSIDCQVRRGFFFCVDSTDRDLLFRSSVCLKVYSSLITRWAILAACTTRGLSEARVLSRTTIRSLDLANGCGQTPHTHLKHGALRRSRSLSTGSLLQTRGLTTTGFQR